MYHERLQKKKIADEEDFADFLKHLFFLFFKFGLGSHDNRSVQFI